MLRPRSSNMNLGKGNTRDLWVLCIVKWEMGNIFLWDQGKKENGKSVLYSCSLSEKDRKNPPPIGSIITYRYQELTDAGIPRFPTYVGVRVDAKWPPGPYYLHLC